jgi:CBS domain-containing membrane protein
MRSRQVKALPVVDAHRQVVGIVTVADFMQHANLEVHKGLGQRLRTLVMGRTGQPAAIGEIMSRPVQVAGEQQHCR